MFSWIDMMDGLGSHGYSTYYDVFYIEEISNLRFEVDMHTSV